jgi:hypothetical protein
MKDPDLSRFRYVAPKNNQKPHKLPYIRVEERTGHGRAGEGKKYNEKEKSPHPLVFLPRSLLGRSFMHLHEFATPISTTAAKIFFFFAPSSSSRLR